MSKKISFLDELEPACHMSRKLDQIMDGVIGQQDIVEKIAIDMQVQFKREYGLTKRRTKLKSKYLSDAHDFIDGYEPPMYLEELIHAANAQMELPIDEEE